MVRPKREPAVGYTCGLCRQPAEPASLASALALLQLCRGCFDKRFAAGMAAQRKALAAEAAHG